MAKTTPMRLVELMVLKQDIDAVIEFLGKKGNFQFQQELKGESDSSSANPDFDTFTKLQQARLFFNIPDITNDDLKSVGSPSEQDRADCEKFLSIVDSLKNKEIEKTEELRKAKEANEEARSFANLKVPYSELDHLSFLSLRIGKIDPSLIDELTFALGGRAVIIPLGEDKSKVLAAASKKGRFALDAELKRFGFVNLEISKDFKGVPDEVLISLDKHKKDAEKELALLEEEKHNSAKTHEKTLRHLLAVYSIANQIQNLRDKLESTSLVYRITGWIPESDSHEMMKELDMISKGRIAIRVYKPSEVPSVISGHEKVPVKLTHGKFVGAFERMIFSYGSPVYGTIDPAPFVALFFTILFGIMFGDAGQGFVFLLIGILMACKVLKVGNWGKFAPIFIGIGCSSMIMGFLTGEFFANSTILLPLSRFIKSLFGVTDPEALSTPILEMMPSASRIKDMFMFFGFTVAVGFIINSVGLIINIINNFFVGKIGKAFFGKTGISGALFFWYVVFLVIRIAAFGHAIAFYDWIVIAITILCTALSSPLSRLVDGERPVVENGMLTLIIEGFVEILEVLSTYLSNSVSFLRVGAFALAHAVLGYIISAMSAIAPGIGSIFVYIVGNAIVIVLEGMIVAIQVIRLQYYEFFSKFFNETGREFKPFAFEYKN